MNTTQNIEQKEMQKMRELIVFIKARGGTDEDCFSFFLFVLELVLNPRSI